MQDPRTPDRSPAAPGDDACPTCGRPLAEHAATSDAPAESIISLSAVRKTYGAGETAVDALKGITLKIKPGRLTAIVGPSGSGKSTLLNLLGALDTPSEGKIRFQDHEITGLSEKQRTRFRARNIGFVFQFLNLLPGLTCLQNVMLGGVIVGMPTGAAKTEAARLLELVGLGDKIKTRARELSGGQMQRVAIARALINNPLLVLADEPTGNLDDRNSREIAELLRERAIGERAIVLVTHNNELANDFADEVITIRDGAVAAHETDSTAGGRRNAAGSTIAAVGRGAGIETAGRASALAPITSLAKADGGPFEIEIGPLHSTEAVIATRHAVEDAAGSLGLAGVRLSEVRNDRAVFTLETGAAGDLVAAVAAGLANGFQNVTVREQHGRRVVLDLNSG